MPDYKKIGQRGDTNPTNGTTASRSVHVRGELWTMFWNDEFFRRHVNPTLYWYGASLLALVCAAAASLMGWWIVMAVALLCPLLALAKGVFSPTRLRVMAKTIEVFRNAYRNGCLLGAVVVEVNPTVLACSAELRYHEGAPSVLGLCRFKVGTLPNIRPEVGQRVPCVAYFCSDRQKLGCWNGFYPRPLSWGISDPTVIQPALDVIAETDWPELDALIKAASNISMGQRDVATFDERFVYLRTFNAGIG